MPEHDDIVSTQQPRPWWGKRVLLFYRDGFRSMTVGRTLWLIIGIKLFIFFVVIKWILFPDFLSSKATTEQGKAQYVREQMQQRVQPPASEPPADAETHKQQK